MEQGTNETRTLPSSIPLVLFEATPVNIYFPTFQLPTFNQLTTSNCQPLDGSHRPSNKRRWEPHALTSDT